MSKQHHHKEKNDSYYIQQKVFGDWKNLLEPPIQLAELVTKITVTPDMPTGFMGELNDYHLTALVIVQRK